VITVDGMVLNRRSTEEFIEVSARLLAQGCVVRFTAEGWSMYPAICDGDTVDLSAVAAPNIRVGDVLLCRLGPTAVAHRVETIDRIREPMQILLRGDAAFARDEPLAANDILAQVIATTRAGVRRRLDTRRARLLGPIVARAWRLKRWARERLSRRQW
jgi:hypothetical protein